MQVTNRSQMSNRVQRVYCDLINSSDLHCQHNVGLVVTDWGIADFYTVILTRFWLNDLNLDPDPGLLWILAVAVINVRSDNLSQKQILPLPTNSERNQTSPQNWFKPKTLLSGERLFKLSSFLTLTLFEFWTPIYNAKGITFRIFKRPKMQVTNRSQMSLRGHWVSCDLRNPSDLPCQLSDCFIITYWGFADFSTVIWQGLGSITQIWTLTLAFDESWQ